MTSQPFQLEPIHTDQYMVTGDVVIAEGVAIAPGVLLQADTGSRIVLASGVCLGMGCVIHASSGEVRVEAGVNLGAGVLVVGQASIGPGTIIGAGSTVFNRLIEAGQLIAPNSLLVDEQVPDSSSSFTSDSRQSKPTGSNATSADTTAKQAPNKQVRSKVNVDGSGFFYAKNGKGSSTLEDPWASASTETLQPTSSDTATVESRQVEAIEPISSSHSDANGSSATETFGSTFEPDATFSSIPDLTPQNTEPPVQSTFIYPNDNCLPKHAWQTSAEAHLGKPEADQTAAYPTNNPTYPNPDSDLSVEEMQGQANNQGNTEAGGSLVKPTPKQVYGQAYVNQMLGRMTGKKS